MSPVTQPLCTRTTGTSSPASLSRCTSTSAWQVGIGTLVGACLDLHLLVAKLDGKNGLCRPIHFQVD